MNVLDRLSTLLKRKDEHPDQLLAAEIVAQGDVHAIKELVAHLNSKNKGIQGDCIKVLCEIGGQEPALISKYADEFVAQLDSRNNLMQWGAMTALSCIAAQVPHKIYRSLTKLAATAERGSVIARDHYVSILVTLASIEAYKADMLVLLNEQILNSPTNQTPTYAEKALQVIDKVHMPLFRRTCAIRLPDMEGKKYERMEQVLKELKAG